MGVITAQLHQCLANRLLQQGLVLGYFPGNNLLHLSIIATICFNQGAGNFAIRANHNLAHRLKLSACLGNEHILAHVILHVLTLNSFVGMTIDNSIHTAGIGSNAFAIPVFNRAVKT